MCRYVNVPSDWERRPEHTRKTIVLNVWGNRVLTYDTVARNPNVGKTRYAKARAQTLVEVEDRNLFTEAQELDRGALDKAWNERKPA